MGLLILFMVPITEGLIFFVFAKTIYHPDLYNHLTSRDPAKFWTSGQWMTEKPGGSDVGNTETIARPVPGDKLMYTLHGIKVYIFYFDSVT